MNNANIIFTCMIFFSHLSVAQNINWQKDPTGQTQYLIPATWEAKVNIENGVFTWLAEEKPGVAGSCVLTVVATEDDGSGLKEGLQYVLGQFLEQMSISHSHKTNNEYHLQASGLIKGIKAKIAAMAIRDQKYLYFAVFGAPARRYVELGGADFFYKAFQRENVYKSDSVFSSSTEPSALDFAEMERPARRQQLLQSGKTVKSADLIGVWQQATAMYTGNDFQAAISGQIKHGRRGYAHQWEFSAIGKYRLTYFYDSFSNGCPYTCKVIEQGRWQLSGGANQLRLSSRSYSAEYNVCSQISQEQKSVLPDLTFKVGTDITGRQLAVTGKPFEFSISQEYDAAGNAYFEEGFIKAK